MELFADQIGQAELEKQETVTLPLFAAKVILACAEDGQHHGQGRRRPPDSTNLRLRKKAVEQWTHDRTAELVATGIKPSHAKNKANEEAQAKFGKLTGRSAQYNKRKAQSKT